MSRTRPWSREQPRSPAWVSHGPGKQGAYGNHQPDGERHCQYPDAEAMWNVEPKLAEVGRRWTIETGNNTRSQHRQVEVKDRERSVAVIYAHAEHDKDERERDRED